MRIQKNCKPLQLYALKAKQLKWSQFCILHNRINFHILNILVKDKVFDVMFTL